MEPKTGTVYASAWLPNQENPNREKDFLPIRKTPLGKTGV